MADDRRLGTIAALIANSNRAPNTPAFSIEDFYPWMAIPAADITADDQVAAFDRTFRY